MAIYHVIGTDGSFTCGDSETGFTSYAYPTSEHATKAKKDAGKVAREMLASELASSHNSESGREYDARNWQTLSVVVDVERAKLCPTCVRSAASPYRRYDQYGKVSEGCVDAFHTGHLVTPSESAFTR